MESRLDQQTARARPSTASGVLQSHDIRHVLDGVRPFTAPGRDQLGYDPTYVTSLRQHGIGPNFVAGGNKLLGKQVHGGIDDKDLKVNHGRRATVGPTEHIFELPDHDFPQRPTTAAGLSSAFKIEDKITLDHLVKLNKAFEFADAQKNRTLNLEEFKSIFRHFLGLKNVTEDQMEALFMKIDSSSDGEINWDEFCTYMQLEYAEKEETYNRAKETAFHLPATVASSPHRDQVLRISHTSDNNFIYVSQDCMVSFWSSALTFKRTRQIESGTKKTRWITDFILMPQFNKFIVGTGDRDIQFYELSTFEPYCQISGLETVPLKLDYCSTGPDECILLYGDSEGCLSIFSMHNVGESLRKWKKMPKIEGVPSISIDSLSAAPNITFVRWKVHNDWVQDVRYYDSIRSVISCSSDPQHSMVIGQTLGSTHLESSLREAGKTAPRKTLAAPTLMRDSQPKRRQSGDETVFKVYKGVRIFDFCKGKNIIATGGMDRLIRVWNPYVPGKPVGVLRGHVTPIFYLFIVAEDNRLFSLSNDKTIRVWDIHDQTCLLTVRPKMHKIRGDLTAVHYNPVLRALAIATDNVALLNVKSKPLSLQMTTTHKEAVNVVKYNKSFKHVVTASENSVVRVWDIGTGQQVFEFSGAHGDSAITCLAFDSTQRRLISGGRDGKLRIWNYNNGHCLKTLLKDGKLGEASAITYVVMNKNRFIISVGWDRRINIFSDDVSNIHHIQKPYIEWQDDLQNGHKEDVLAIAYCLPNLLATASYDGEIIIWNLISGHIFCKLHSTLPRVEDDNGNEGECQAISQLLFLQKRQPNKKSATLFAGGPSGYVFAWNVYNGGCQYAAMRVPSKANITSLTTNGSNDYIFVGNAMGFVTVFDVRDYCLTGPTEKGPTVRSSWRAHTESITTVELAEEFGAVLTSSIDCTVRLWNYDGHFIGTFGQPVPWDISLPSTFQHPMAPYDVLMDPGSLPQHPSLGNGSDSKVNKDSAQTSKAENIDTSKLSQPYLTSKHNIVVDDAMIESLLKEGPSRNSVGKRLRHERLRLLSSERGKASAYKSLKCYDLEETPDAPEITSNENIDDPFDIKI